MAPARRSACPTVRWATPRWDTSISGPVGSFYQDITRIDKAIKDGAFFDNDILVAGMERVALEKKAVHLFGLVSDGKVHSSLDHIYALVELARGRV